MNKKNIVGSIIIIVFLVVAGISFFSTKTDYSDFEKAKKTSSSVQIIGSVVKENPVDYNPQSNTLEFTLKDKSDQIAQVSYLGAKPNNFDIAPYIVVKGKFEGNVFQAREILTKCPSKYDDEKQNMTNNVN